MMMMMMMMIVKNTPADVHESYSCWYNISAYSVVHIMAPYIWAPYRALERYTEKYS